VLTQDDTVIFVGSGISRWSGLPSWEGLIGELGDYLEQHDVDAKLLRHEAAVPDLLQAASYGFLKLTLPQIAEFMRQTCRVGSAVPHRIHQAIMNLSPSCFITTNYDDLLEQAYRAYRPTPPQPRIVLNTQLLEQAEIIHAQAREFIFKPHGDAGTVGSIVLTREQYRTLLPGGPLGATMKTLETLLQSRPVLFLGFGLRDPDFLYLRDILANIYRGGMRDHYAIVADPVSDQQEYWRRHYGIHLVGYATADHGRDHSALLTLLEGLENKTRVPPSASGALDISDAAGVLALARYAASCLAPQTNDRFDIRVTSLAQSQTRFARPVLGNYWPVERLLVEGPNQLILIGEPGAGKSFAIRYAVNRLASELQDACLRGELNRSMRVPIVVDLKLYEGDLTALISAKFPSAFDLVELKAAFPVCLYLDGYNELPRNFREDGTFDRQLAELLETHPDMGLVIGSRSADGLDRLQLPIFFLSEISEAEVERRLKTSGILLPHFHRQDIVQVLQRPFYYRLLDDAVMSLEAVRGPGDLYAQFVEHIRTRFEAAFGTDVDIKAVLQRHAYQCLEQGSEAFAISDLATEFSASAPQLSALEIDEVCNWLASAEFIIPMRNQRASFVHQSVTEYLAACELKNRLAERAEDVDPLLAMRRWDNAIFLALGMLDAAATDALLAEIITCDINFAFKGARFVQHGGEALISKLLGVVAEMPNNVFNHEASFAFARLPFVAVHEAPLRHILDTVPQLRGETFVALADVIGEPFKKELTNYLFNENAFGSLRSIGRALSRLIESADLRELVEWLVKLDPASLDEDHGETHERVAAVAAAVGGLPVADIRRETLERFDHFGHDQQRITATLIGEIYTDTKSNEGLMAIIDTARLRLPKSLFPLYLNVRYDPGQRQAFLAQVDDALFDTIMHFVDSGDRWSVDLLETCGEDGGVNRRLRNEAARSTGIRRSILTYCATKNPSEIFSALERWADRPGNGADLILIETIDFNDLDWNGYHDLFVSLLARHDLDLTYLILGGSLPPAIRGLDNIDLGDLDSWIDWLLQLVNQQDGPNGKKAYWVSNQLAILIARSQSPETKTRLLAMLDSDDPALRWVVGAMVLPNLEGLTLSDFSSKGMATLVSLLLSGHGKSEFSPHVFAQIADEQFARRELLPLAQEEGAREAIAEVLQQVGRRLGMRFRLPPLDAS